MVAASKGRLKTLELLVTKGASLDMADKGRMTALLHAVQVGQLDVVKRLVALGADIHWVDSHGKNALMIAVQEGHPLVASYMHDRGTSRDVVAMDGTTMLM